MTVTLYHHPVWRMKPYATGQLVKVLSHNLGKTAAKVTIDTPEGHATGWTHAEDVVMLNVAAVDAAEPVVHTGKRGRPRSADPSPEALRLREKRAQNAQEAV